MGLNLFHAATPYGELPPSDRELKELLNYNPHHNRYTAKQNFPGRNPNETDRGGWRGYDRVYSRYFTSKKLEPIHLLEIGIYFGYGLLAWRRFFPNGKIFGVDNVIDVSRVSEFKSIEKGYPEFKSIKKDIMDTTKSDDWLLFYNKQFDVIIDDGGHHPDTQIPTLKNAWQHLKTGGLYFIEDISHRYTDKKLEKLNEELNKLKEAGNTVEVYSHVNTGLLHILSDPALRKRFGIADSAPMNAEEYITVITKNE